MRFLICCCAVALAFFSTAPPVTAQQDQPTTGNLLGDARIIITSNKQDVRLWAHPPRVLVLTSDRFAIEELGRIRQRLEDAVNPSYGETLFGPWSFAEVDPDFAKGDFPIRFDTVKGGPSGGEVLLRLGPDQEYRTDIVIAVLDRQSLALMNGLWGYIPARWTRAQLKGSRASCYYSSRSLKGVRHVAYVSVLARSDQKYLADCLWEEVLHTLGPLVDAKGSAFFTFDDKPGISLLKRANDIALIRALYESGAKPGDNPEIVIRHLKTLLGDMLDLMPQGTGRN